MTYFGFLLRFLVLPLALAWLVYGLDAKKHHAPGSFLLGRRFWLYLGLHVLLAVIYTTPWDNYLVASGVWYYNPRLISGILLGYVPLEEYIFFVLETLLVGLWWGFFARRQNLPGFKPAPVFRLVMSGLLGVLWIFFTLLFFLGPPQYTYLSIIAFWAFPAIAPQFIFGADILWHYRRLLLLTILPMFTYLSIVDSFAIADTTWTIAPHQSLGVLLGGILPLEEAFFFAVTVILVSFGMTLSLSPEANARAQHWFPRLRRK